MKIDRSPNSRLQELVRDGMISEGKHPTEDLWIYNYTPSCVFAKAWNKLTLQARGLILAEDGTVVARPFEKFFNVEEESASDIRWKKSFQVFEKLDGSLGIMYREPKSGERKIATRGSFTSEQAIRGTELLKTPARTERATEVAPGVWTADWHPDDAYTYLFEIIYPQNRIVLNYGNRAELVFLCAVHKETGANVFEFGTNADWPGTHVKRHDAQGLQIRELKSLELENEEGFVVFFPHNSTRMKTKFTEYVRLHRIVTKTNSKRIWESMRNGDSFEELLKDTPDEFFDWVEKVREGFSVQYRAIERDALDKYERITGNASIPLTRKDFAAKAGGHRYSGILFKMYDGHDYSDTIWKMIKPKQAQGFVTVSDEEV